MSSFLQFEFSEEQLMLQEMVRKYLAAECGPDLVRDVLEGRQSHVVELWSGLAEMGCLGAAIPEEDGGSGFGYVELCIIAEELGRVLAPVPSVSGIYLFAEIIKSHGSDEQKAALLAPLCQGDLIGSLAHLELDEKGRRTSVKALFNMGTLSGSKDLVADGSIANQLLVLARDEAGGSLYLVDISQEGVSAEDMESIDPTRRVARIRFSEVPAELVGQPGGGAAIVEEAINHAAIFNACEQIGGAERALEMACEYARERMAFGRPIGSFQAVKQLLADMYVALAIGQANCRYATWALASRNSDITAAAARAQLSAANAFRLCSQDNIQVHGGTGFMWDSDPHVFYRRARHLELSLAPKRHWEELVVANIGPSEAENADQDLGESEDEQAFRKTARDWLKTNAPWHLQERIKQSSVGALDLGEDKIAAAKDWQKKKFDGGWACLHWPKEYGGRAASPVERIIWHQEEGDFAKLGNLFHNGQTMGAPTLMDYASAELKADMLPKIASGELVGCQLFSEPAAGSDLAGLRTRAARDGDEWTINGQKIWTSYGTDADWGILIARSDFDVAKHKGLTAFLVDMHADGIEALPIRQMNEQSGFAELFFTDLKISDDRRLGEEGEGWKVALTMLSHERLAIGLEMPTGFDELLDYCQLLEMVSGPALDNPHIVSTLAGFEMQATGLHNFMLGSMAQFAKGILPGPENSIVKLAAGQMMQEIAGFAMELQEEAGVLAGSAEKSYAGRFQGMWLRAPATRIEGGSDQILRNIIAERVLGMPPDLRADKDIAFRDIATAAAS